MLSLDREQRDELVAHCVRGLPDEACALLIGDVSGRVSEVRPARNIAGSARLYEVEPKDILAALRRADELGVEVIGVAHSHTHSDAYPSPTDVARAPDGAWHYVIVSLRHVPTVVRSFRIVDGEVTEEAVEVRDVGP